MAIKIHAGEITLKCVTVKCYRCGDPLNVEIEPGSKVPRKYCPDCKKTSGELNDMPSNEELRRGMRLARQKCQPVGWITYRPGDPGFAERAAMVAPVSSTISEF